MIKFPVGGGYLGQYIDTVKAEILIGLILYNFIFLSKKIVQINDRILQHKCFSYNYTKYVEMSAFWKPLVTVLGSCTETYWYVAR